MNKKLITLAVAAAIAAPAAAMAEATLYGKLNQTIDYGDVSNAISPTYEFATSEDIRFVPGRVNSDGSVRQGAYYYNGYEVSAGEAAQISGGGLIQLGPNGKPIVSDDGEDFSGWGVSRTGAYMPGQGRANRLGVKGSEDLGNGLKAIYQVEFGININADDNNIPSGNNGISYRNSFVGLAGDWGTALIGRHDTPLKISTAKLDLFADTMADYNTDGTNGRTGTVGFDDMRVDNTIAYISPSFSGFSFAGAIVAPGGATASGVSNIESDSLAGAYSLAAIYANGPFYASAAWESMSDEMFMNTGTSMAGEDACWYDDGTGTRTRTLSCSYVEDAYDKWRVGLGLLDWNGFTLAAIYENQDNLPGGQTRQSVSFVREDGSIGTSGVGSFRRQELWQIQAGYSFGNSMVKAMFGQADRSDVTIINGAGSEGLTNYNVEDDLEGDRTSWAIGFDHNFSKRTKAYALYTNNEDDLEDVPGYAGYEWSGFSMGLMHSF